MARSFNGTSDRIRADAARVCNKATACSFCAWVFYPSPATGREVYAEATTANTNNLFGFLTDTTTPSKVNLGIKINVSSPNTVNITGTATAFEAAWHHLLFTQDTGNNCKVYVDGIVDISTSYSSAATYSANNLAIGALVRTSTTAFFGGRIAEVANWTRTLSAAEAVSLASGLPASHFAPAHYWPLWGSDSPEPDIGTGTHVTGTLTGTSAASGGRTGRRLLTLV